VVLQQCSYFPNNNHANIALKYVDVLACLILKANFLENRTVTEFGNKAMLLSL
jgi:hypothetical protein